MKPIIVRLLLIALSLILLYSLALSFGCDFGGSPITTPKLDHNTDDNSTGNHHSSA
jgi:hypothetical protein